MAATPRTFTVSIKMAAQDISLAIHVQDTFD